ncbi:ABC transporter ATP-binding protein [Pseudomonas aeruginosa]|jgi:putative ABC transport system ATP-binding protein|uniref:ABC transporter ATP-binding protein n=2 Tax=Pseudomonadota TaxID=1224 RepID=A0A235EZM1_9RHOO|nr:MULTISPECIES: ABC transporter ATP-binding protein [Pseudomonadota]MBP6760239.1 ABC transporter ATP-binding protein [Thauera sp.]MBP8262230.1 ABC transporter ATP-binding protein [Pseudomonas sp.]WGL63526.1 ABC transporter ATP-binding protein [Pseudomonas sp. CW003PS]HAY5206603.1 ABC transporter ATP-binding protein [Escherichia coli]HCK7120270.1 ABC transporter ATP-binding protein [Klebsiella pneumoniae]
MQRVHDTDLIRLENITHAYATGASSQAVLYDVSFSVPTGQSCAIVGASGSGKSTLLNLIGLLDEPTSGRVLLAGEDMTNADAESRAIARNRIIGFVFQSFNLLPRLDALDNVALPLLYRGIPQPQARQAALTQLERVGLSNRSHHRPADMSGGQRQRVAIARALVGEPSLLLADEPTGNLDSQTAQDIIGLLLSLNRERGTTLVVVTHDTGIADRMARCIQVRDGRIEEAGHA